MADHSDARVVHGTTGTPRTGASGAWDMLIDQARAEDARSLSQMLHLTSWLSSPAARRELSREANEFR
jgi:hypothetical protein